jgi:hypothetical protein
MAREAETERLRKLVDIAEDMGFRVWFDFKQCHIHEMYGKEVAWFDLDDQNRFWVDSVFLVASRGKYFRDICDILGTFVQNIGKANIVAVEDKDYEGLGLYNHDMSKDKEKPSSPIENKAQPPIAGPSLDENNNNSFFRTNF